ncbi:pantoate--beta-alanine ligase [Alkaliphilus pronyensis]|uniref:Pantothenate synthetase n=1 Tax=Alkaliphilus pronyensis TaxID=1482732 RepID=A0A6I0FBI6_9FIRM|nr:pantoate--beta-alanine ligase [Alkaliphilus pronyensis]KAB3537702.1 pantoate--beta-alanine ligase [Alkaliphilus pronyensis]
MKTIKTVKEMKEIVDSYKASFNKTIGLVPTMGYLHDGHLSLIKRAREENHIVIVSVFVNPTQFGVNEDYEIYPKDIKRDKELAEAAGADYMFHPTVEEMYPTGHKTYVEVLDITDKLCGASRPGHFKGVTTIVNKLFQIVEPNRAYFGLKDAQQVAVVQQMVRDLFLNTEIVPCPIVREPDGLAMSSRNILLSPEDRQAALILSKGLMEAKKIVDCGEKNVFTIKEKIIKIISQEPTVNIDYIEMLQFPTLEAVSIIGGKVLIAIAAKVGNVRLIDNIIMEE